VIGKKGRELRTAYKEVFRSPQGEKVLADLADLGCMMRPTYVKGDPHMTSFSEGARSIVLGIFAKIDKDESYARELEARRKKAARQQDQLGDDE
jgi:hypothetical protein